MQLLGSSYVGLDMHHQSHGPMLFSPPNSSRLNLKFGSYEANPPFVPPIMEASVRRMTDLLETAEVGSSALSFAVIVPGW